MQRIKINLFLALVLFISSTYLYADEFLAHCKSDKESDRQFFTVLLDQFRLRYLKEKCQAIVDALRTIKQVNINDRRKIQDLDLLKYLDQLEILRLRNIELNDLQFLSELNNLKTLSIDNVKMKQFLQFESKRLIHLSFAFTNISDFNFVGKYRGLEYLSLIGNSGKIDNIEWISGLHNLREIRLSGGELNDISPLVNLTELRQLYLNNLALTDISKLVKLNKLEKLELPNNHIQDILPVRKLIFLRKIDLNRNQIKNIAPLAMLDKLKSVNVSQNLISDIEPLSGLSELEYISLKYNKVRDISSLRSLKKLKGLSVDSEDLNRCSPKDKLELRSGLKRCWGITKFIYSLIGI